MLVLVWSKGAQYVNHGQAVDQDILRWVEKIWWISLNRIRWKVACIFQKSVHLQSGASCQHCPLLYIPGTLLIEIYPLLVIGDRALFSLVFDFSFSVLTFMFGFWIKCGAFQRFQPVVKHECRFTLSFL